LASFSISSCAREREQVSASERAKRAQRRTSGSGAPATFFSCCERSANNLQRQQPTAFARAEWAEVAGECPNNLLLLCERSANKQPPSLVRAER
jgi:hypothetical protein